MSHIYSFEKLNVWQESKDFIKEIYRVTESYPKKELFGIVSQINRASVSIACNIAEGSGRTSNKDQAHFYQIAYSSCLETICLLKVSQELGYFDEIKHLQLRSKLERITVQINFLRKERLNFSTPKPLNNRIAA